MPAQRTWDPRADHTRSPDLGLVLDPDPADDGSMAGRPAGRAAGLRVPRRALPRRRPP
ncbi:hypothetical protein ACWCQZ_33840 [Streptomyces sp. NPDC002285]